MRARLRTRTCIRVEPDKGFEGFGTAVFCRSKRFKVLALPSASPRLSRHAVTLAYFRGFLVICSRNITWKCDGLNNAISRSFPGLLRCDGTVGEALQAADHAW